MSAAAAACRCGSGAPAGSGNGGEASVPGAQEGRKGGRAVCLTLEMRSACGRRPVARLGCGGVGDFIDGLRPDRARRRSDACPRCRTRTCWAPGPGLGNICTGFPKSCCSHSAAYKGEKSLDSSMFCSDADSVTLHDDILGDIECHRVMSLNLNPFCSRSITHNSTVKIEEYQRHHP